MIGHAVTEKLTKAESEASKGWSRRGVYLIADGAGGAGRAARGQAALLCLVESA